MKKYIAILVAVFVSVVSSAHAQELRKTKNADSYIMLGMRNSVTGKFITGAAPTCEFNYYEDGTAPQVSASTCANTVTEVGVTGRYYVKLNAAELNHGYTTVIIDSAAANSTPLLLNINLNPIDVVSGVQSALNTAIGANPTSGSINQRIKDLTESTGQFLSGSTTTSFVLAATAPSNSIVGDTISIDNGVGVGASATVLAYNTSSKVATVTAVTTAPASGDSYTIITAPKTLVGNVTGNVNGFVNSLGAGAITAATYAAGVVEHYGTAQSVTANTIRLAASETYGDNVLSNMNSIYIVNATAGKGQMLCACSNVGSTDIVTLCGKWPITPTGTVTYAVLPTANCNLAKYPTSR